MNLHVNLIFFQLNKTVNQIATYQKAYMRYVSYDIGIWAVCIIFRLPEKENPLYSKPLTYIPKYVSIETVQDFLIKLGIKPNMHILEIIIFPLNYVIVRPTKIVNNLLKDCKIGTFKVLFKHQKSMEFF